MAARPQFCMPCSIGLTLGEISPSSLFSHLSPLPLPRRIRGETGRLLPAFLLGATTTVIGSAAAYMMMPLGRFIGEDGWKIASALTVCGEEGAVCDGVWRMGPLFVVGGEIREMGWLLLGGWAGLRVLVRRGAAGQLVSCTALWCLHLYCSRCPFRPEGPKQTICCSSPAWTPPHADLPPHPLPPPMQARHIGGAVNYMAVTDALAVSPSVFGAGRAADDLILTLYFTTIYTLAKSIPPDPPPSTIAGTVESGISGTHTEP